MAEPKTPHFHDFEIFGRAPEPQNQHDLSLERPGYINSQAKKNIYVYQNLVFETWELKRLKTFELRVPHVLEVGM